MTQTLTIIGHRTAFNNEQSPYRILSAIKGPDKTSKYKGYFNTQLSKNEFYCTLALIFEKSTGVKMQNYTPNFGVLPEVEGVSFHHAVGGGRKFQ